MDTRVWGKHAWIFIDSILLNIEEPISETEMNNISQFFNLLQHILPCPGCRKHYKEYIEKNPLDGEILSSKDKIIDWRIKLQNTINKRLGKKEINLEDYVKFYNNLYGESSVNFKNIMLLLLFGGLISYFIYKHN